MPDALIPLPTAASFSYIGAQSIWRYPSGGQSSPHSPPPRDREDRIEWKTNLVSKLKGRFPSNYARFTYVPKPIAGIRKPDESLKAVLLLTAIFGKRQDWINEHKWVRSMEGRAKPKALMRTIKSMQVRLSCIDFWNTLWPAWIGDLLNCISADM